jgi:ABC-type nitrate/sulfonate/bicarbonate transport system substrate-binding protein
MISRRSLVTAIVATATAPLVPRTAGAAEKWSHAIVKAKGDAAFFYMAQKKRFWARRGLSVEFVELKGSKDVIGALLAGEVDSSDSLPADVLPAVEKGAGLRFVGAAVHGCPYAMYVRPQINGWAELADKTFGVSAPGSAPHIFALATLETNNVPTEKIRLANAGGSTGRVKALAAGRLDATVASTEFIPMVDELKVKVLGLAKEMAPMFPRFYEVMSARTIERRHHAAIRFLAGYMEGLRYCVDHRDEAINLSAEINDERPGPRYAFAYDEIVNSRMVSLNMEVPRDKIAWMQDTMIRVKQQEKPVDIDRLIDTRLRDQALELVGRR